MSKTTHAKVVIIGSGPAGYTAAIYAARAMLEPVLIQGYQAGGQLTITTDVENYPGFADVIQGPWLMEQMQKQAEHVGTRVVTDHVNNLDTASRPFRLTCNSGDVYLRRHRGPCDRRAGALARSSVRGEIQGLRRFGLRDLRWLLLSRQGSNRGRRRQYRGRGGSVSHQFRDQGDDRASPRLFRAERILQDRLFKNPKIEVMWDSVVEDLAGSENPSKVTSATIKNFKTGAVTERKVDGVFVAIGHTPATELVQGKVEMKPSGYVATAPNSTSTSVPGLFAAGDVTDDIYRQAVTAAGQGCMAALEAEQFLAAHAQTRVAAE